MHDGMIGFFFAFSAVRISFYINLIILIFFLGVFLESPTEFTVDAKSVTGSGSGTCRMFINITKWSSCSMSC